MPRPSSPAVADATLGAVDQEPRRPRAGARGPRLGHLRCLSPNFHADVWSASSSQFAGPVSRSGSGDVLTYCAAATVVDVTDLVDLYWAGHCTLLTPA